MRSVELFAGGGGLALGVARAGFHHLAIVERDRWSCETIEKNIIRGVAPVRDWPKPFKGDIRKFEYDQLVKRVAFVSGGPPCQPFSIGGKHKAFDDERDMFPEAARAVSSLRPSAFLFENVKGLLRPKFNEYFEYTLLRLTYPSLIKKMDENWVSHKARLESEGKDHAKTNLVYNVSFKQLNAADYGVPQCRSRVFIIGVRSDILEDYIFPTQTHSFDRLIWDQWVTGEYWDEHKISALHRPVMTPRLQAKIAKLKKGERPSTNRWRTVRDAIGDLPEPVQSKDYKSLNHRLVPGARSYVGHTGSVYDLPAKTLKAGVHGVPGGENMLLRLDGTVRYFSIREAARLQTFPDEYKLEGAWSECMRQLGNAVPVSLAEVVSRNVKTLLERNKRQLKSHFERNENQLL